MMSQAIPGPRSLRNSATRVVASTPGMHAISLVSFERYIRINRPISKMMSKMISPALISHGPRQLYKATPIWQAREEATQD
jgi:hypothetical protein